MCANAPNGRGATPKTKGATNTKQRCNLGNQIKQRAGRGIQRKEKLRLRKAKEAKEPKPQNDTQNVRTNMNPKKQNCWHHNQNSFFY